MDINLGVTESISDILSRMLIMLTTVRALTILGLGVLTFKFLDLFLETNIVIARKKVDQKKMKALLWSLMLLLFSIVPIVVVITRLIKGDFRATNLLYMLIIGASGCFIFGFPLKHCLPEDDPRRKQWILLMDAFSIAIEVIAENIAYWIQALVIRIINTILDILRAPFISYYLLVGTILNLGLSFAITGFMGSSQMAGEVNIIGSLIGGVAHAIVRGKKIAELKKALEKEDIPNEKNI